MKKLLLTFLLCNSAFAGNCDYLYPKSKELAVTGTVELCNSFYVSRFDALAHKVILTSEVVRPSRDLVKRTNDFRADYRVPYPVSPKQYLNTGYDRGHMVPAADATSEKEMHETFFMTNMTPQEPTLNRKSWKNLEERIRQNSTNLKLDLVVVTGAVYEAQPKLVNKIPVPQAYYKVVFFPDGKTDAYYAPNIKDSVVKPTSIKDIETFSGISFQF